MKIKTTSLIVGLCSCLVAEAAFSDEPGIPGRLEISLPDAGVYALLDHSGRHQRGSGGKTRDSSGKVFGFTGLKLKLRNVSPDIALSGDNGTMQSMPQDMLDGVLWALASYRLNQCYQPDLSGEFKFGQRGLPLEEKMTFSKCPGAIYKSGTELISVSRPLKVGAGGLAEIPRQAPVDLEFDFSIDPIPVNAWDLSLKMIYRGRLGPKQPERGYFVQEDALIVTAKDISEPSYLSIRNWTDVQTNGKYEAHRQESVFADVTDFRLMVNGAELFRVAKVPGYRFARIVYLSDYERIKSMQVEWRDGSHRTISKVGVLVPSMTQWTKNQKNSVSASFRYQQFWGVRKTYHSKQVLVRRDDLLIKGPPPKTNWNNRESFTTLENPDPITAMICFPDATPCQKGLSLSQSGK